jgi:hypothetical protein
MCLPGGLEGAQPQDDIGNGALDPEEREQAAKDLLGRGVTRLIAKEGTPLGRVGLLAVVPTAERVGQEPDRALVYHADLEASVIASGLSSLALVRLRFLHSDVPLAVNDTGDVGDVCSLHIPPKCGLREYNPFEGK